MNQNKSTVTFHGTPLESMFKTSKKTIQEYVREIDNKLIIFSEWCEGGSLQDVTDNGNMYVGTSKEQEQRVISIALQSMLGLRYTHKMGVIHKDIKPANIMLNNKAYKMNPDDEEYTIDLSALRPTIAFPHLPENTHTIDEIEAEEKIYIDGIKQMISHYLGIKTSVKKLGGYISYDFKDNVFYLKIVVLNK